MNLIISFLRNYRQLIASLAIFGEATHVLKYSSAAFKNLGLSISFFASTILILFIVVISYLHHHKKIFLPEIDKKKLEKLNLINLAIIALQTLYDNLTFIHLDGIKVILIIVMLCYSLYGWYVVLRLEIKFEDPSALLDKPPSKKQKNK